jgi:hypothetical protein
MAKRFHYPSYPGRPVRWWKIVLLVTVMAVAMVIGGIALVRMEHNHKQKTLVHYRERMEPGLTEPGLTPAELALNPNLPHPKVTIGVYVDRIVNMSVKDLSWTVDCYLWFRWQDSTLKIGENFQVVDGWIESKEKKKEYHQQGNHYVLYRLVARITAVFEEFRFPCDDHLLTICIEEPSYDRDHLIFEADSLNSSVSSRAKAPGYSIYKTAVVEKPHSYKTTRGDPEFVPGTKATYSQFRMGMWIKRQSWGYFLKMFLPLFVAVAVALLAFFVNPMHSDPRFGLGIGALFAAVANSYITSNMLPNTGVMSLADVINLVGTITILLTLILSAISLFIYERKSNHQLSHRFDRYAFYLMLIGYLVLNIALPRAAGL